MVKYANLNLVMKSLDLPGTVRSLVSVHSLEKNLVIFPEFTSFTSSTDFCFDIFSVDKKFSSSSYKPMSNLFACARPNDKVLPRKPDKIIFLLKLTASGQCTSID